MKTDVKRVWISRDADSDLRVDIHTTKADADYSGTFPMGTVVCGLRPGEIAQFEIKRVTKKRGGKQS